MPRGRLHRRRSATYARSSVPGEAPAEESLRRLVGALAALSAAFRDGARAAWPNSVVHTRAELKLFRLGPAAFVAAPGQGYGPAAPTARRA
jgi:hypothetical protein